MSAIEGELFKSEAGAELESLGVAIRVLDEGSRGIAQRPLPMGRARKLPKGIRALFERMNA